MTDATEVPGSVRPGLNGGHLNLMPHSSSPSSHSGKLHRAFTDSRSNPANWQILLAGLSLYELPCRNPHTEGKCRRLGVFLRTYPQIGVGYRRQLHAMIDAEAVLETFRSRNGMVEAHI